MADRYTPDKTRRSVLETIGAVGTLSTVGSRVVQGQPTNKETPETYEKHGTQGNSFESPAYFRHVSDLAAGRQRVHRYERTGNSAAIISPHLRKRMSRTTQDTINITVTTTGQRTKQVTKGSYGRTFYGWRPSKNEIKELTRYGEVTYVPEFASTKATVSNVAVDDVTDLADLPFVLAVGYEPTISSPDRVSTISTTTSSTTPTADKLKSDDHHAFDAVSQDIDSGIRIGYFAQGYEYGDGGSVTPYTQNWAEAQGIDTDLAESFAGETSWKDGTWHSMMVTDTTAYMLTGHIGWDNHVPLKIDHYETTINASAWRNALEYALEHGIEVGVSSHQEASDEPYCTSTLCDHLDSYTSAGYVMTIATGNDSLESEVCHPATSYHAVSVGGFSGECSEGYERSNNSNYGKIKYYNNTYDTAYCPWCHEDKGDSGFQPNVYSCYEFNTDDGTTISGTSAASPVVGAGTAIHASAHGAINYQSHVQKYNNMSDHTICPTVSSKLGDVLHAPDLE